MTKTIIGFNISCNTYNMCIIIVCWFNLKYDLLTGRSLQWSKFINIELSILTLNTHDTSKQVHMSWHAHAHTHALTQTFHVCKNAHRYFHFEVLQKFEICYGWCLELSCCLCVSLQTSSDRNVFHLPILNIRRDEFRLRLEVVFLLMKHGLDPNLLTFVDEVNLRDWTATEDVMLTLTLVDHHMLIESQAFLDDRVCEVIDHRPLASELPERWIEYFVSWFNKLGSTFP